MSVYLSGSSGELPLASSRVQSASSVNIVLPLGRRECSTPRMSHQSHPMRGSSQSQNRKHRRKKSIRMLECEVAEQRRRKQQPAELTLRNLAQQYMFTLVFIYISGQLACSVMGARSKTGQSWRQRRGMQGCQGNWVCICMFTWIQLPLNDDHQNVSDNCVSFAP